MSAPILAAGALCWRREKNQVTVLVVRRAKYNDVSLPKGKLDPGETLPQTAIREVREETGLWITLGAKLGTSAYTISSGKDKRVDYWAAEISDTALATSTFTPNNEIAAIEWVPLKHLRERLTYERDTVIVEEFERLMERGISSTFSLIIMRHGKALPRGEWTGPDALRPLLPRGVMQVAANVPSLTAWSPHRIFTSDALRCVTTVAPLAAATGISPRLRHDLSQDAYEDGTAQLRPLIDKRLHSAKTSVLCSHGPVIPEILNEIARIVGTIPSRELRDASRLEPGGFSVITLSCSQLEDGIASVETYPPVLA